ncbi:protein of unknown function [Methanocaldococcus lauensis]|nr:protein of unknown function [Methanocaldococcus lauensis]
MKDNINYKNLIYKKATVTILN